jgi:exonuclease SbcD
MKILHTSDWHLGQNFMGKSREEEHQAFFIWLLKHIQSEQITLLIVAGDIFDTATPPNYALELYYNFLKELSSIKELTTVIVAGNHDSISTLKTSQQLLKALNIYVITKGCKEESQLIPIYRNKKIQALVCAVPFLRDSVLRQSQSGEGVLEREKFANQAIKEYYEVLYKEALKFLKKRGVSPKETPIIATGHLTTVGARSSESERDIYIGGTFDIGGDFLGKDFDYVALGHLHQNQKVGFEHVRYSGSPIPLSFSEAKSLKQVNVIEFSVSGLNVRKAFALNRVVTTVRTIEIPSYRSLLLLKGTLEKILESFRNIENKEVWIEVQLMKDDNPFASNQSIRSLAKKLNLTLLAVKINKQEKSLRAKEMNVISLDDLGVSEVFEKRLKLENLESKNFEKELIQTFNMVLERVKGK